jgi:hypothetical protein
MVHKYPWPKINNVSQSVEAHTRQFLDTASLAADVIAFAWTAASRRRAGRGSNAAPTLPAPAPPSPRHALLAQRALEWRGNVSHGHIEASREFHDYFVRRPIAATEKYDGTNVGVTEDGLVLGRRLTIPPDCDKYQSTSLAEVRRALSQVARVKAALLPPPVIEAVASRLHCTVYGELMCNSSRFDYAKRHLGAAFCVFGVMLRGEQVSATCVSIFDFGGWSRWLLLLMGWPSEAL